MQIVRVPPSEACCLDYMGWKTKALGTVSGRELQHVPTVIQENRMHQAILPQHSLAFPVLVAMVGFWFAGVSGLGKKTSSFTTGDWSPQLVPNASQTPLSTSSLAWVLVFTFHTLLCTYSFIFHIWRDLLKLAWCPNALFVLTLASVYHSTLRCFFMLAGSWITPVLDPQAHLLGSLHTLKTWRRTLNLADYTCSSRSICWFFPLSSALLGSQWITQWLVPISSQVLISR